MAKQSLNDDQRQQYIDNLPKEQVNPNAEQTFNAAIVRAVQPKQSKPEKQVGSGDYTDTQTHSGTTEGAYGSRSDTSHQ